jgi:hypothetical protein
VRTLFRLVDVLFWLLSLTVLVPMALAQWLAGYDLEKLWHSRASPSGGRNGKSPGKLWRPPSRAGRPGSWMAR